MPVCGLIRVSRSTVLEVPDYGMTEDREVGAYLVGDTGFHRRQYQRPMRAVLERLDPRSGGPRAIGSTCRSNMSVKSGEWHVDQSARRHDAVDQSEVVFRYLAASERRTELRVSRRI